MSNRLRVVTATRAESASDLDRRHGGDDNDRIGTSMLQLTDDEMTAFVFAVVTGNAAACGLGTPVGDGAARGSHIFP